MSGWLNKAQLVDVACHELSVQSTRPVFAGADSGFRPSRPAPGPPSLGASLRAASCSEEQPTLGGQQPPDQPAEASLAAAPPITAAAAASGGDTSSEATAPAGVPGGMAFFVEGPSELHTSDSAVAVAGSVMGDSTNWENAGAPPSVPSAPGGAELAMSDVSIESKSAALEARSDATVGGGVAPSATAGAQQAVAGNDTGLLPLSLAGDAPGQETLEADTAASTAAVAGSVVNDEGDPASQSAVAGSDDDVVPHSDPAPAGASPVIHLAAYLFLSPACWSVTRIRRAPAPKSQPQCRQRQARVTSDPGRLRYPACNPQRINHLQVLGDRAS